MIFSKTRSEIEDLIRLQPGELEKIRGKVNLEEEPKTHISLWEVDRAHVSALSVYDPLSLRWVSAKSDSAYILLAIEKQGGNETFAEHWIGFPSAMNSLIESIDLLNPDDLNLPFAQGKAGVYSFRLFNLAGKNASKETRAVSVVRTVELEDWLVRGREKSLLFVYFGFYISGDKIKFGNRANLVATLENKNVPPKNLVSYKFLWELITDEKFVHPDVPDVREALIALCSFTTTTSEKGKFALDLDSLPSNSAEQSDEESDGRETARRLAKLKQCEQECSCVFQNSIFVAGHKVAGDGERLAELGITHILNCAGDFCENEHSSRFVYRTYFIKDSKLENIECLFYEAIEFIESAISSGGKILIHCMQGVSRSVTLAVAFVQFRLKIPYTDAFEMVRKARTIASPNIGFVSQLIFWEKRLLNTLEPKNYPLIFVAGSHSSDDPRRIVLRLVR